MSRIRSRGNRDTELALARLLRAHRIWGWRRHVRVVVESRASRVEGRTRSGARPSSFVPRLTVRPDFVFHRSRTVIFVDGCFWHGCPRHCKYAKWLTPDVVNNPPSPKGRLRRTGRAFWQRKLAGNKRRDALVTCSLRRASWRVLRIWECDLAKRPENCVRRVERAMKSSGDASSPA